MDKWFAVQAMSNRADTLDRVKKLMSHSAFSIKKPNKVRALVGAFAMGNPVRFHAADGTGYRFVADVLVQLDGINPQVAARMLGVFGQWRRLPADRSRLMREQLERIAKTSGLSRDSLEIATKSLGE
jgi:aminopeptidase N